MGFVDSGFGNNGIFISPFRSYPNAAAIQSDGKLVVSGRASFDTSGNDYIAAARYLTGLTTGIFDFKNEHQELFIYPNPVLDVAYIKYSLEKNETISIFLSDLNGRKLKSIISQKEQSAGAHWAQIKLEDQVSGLYFITLTNGQTTKTIRVIKD